MKIAITGKMCSGKTTLSHYICQIEPRFQIFSFGKKVKEVAITLFNMNPSVKDRSLLTAPLNLKEPVIWKFSNFNFTDDCFDKNCECISGV